MPKAVLLALLVFILDTLQQLTRQSFAGWLIQTALCSGFPLALEAMYAI